MEIIVLLTVLIATVVGSISGIGGGVLIKPVMDAVCTMTSNQISFMSGTTVLAMTIASLIRSRDEIKRIDRCAVMLALGAAVGGVAGKQLFNIIRDRASDAMMVSLVQNIIMVLLTGAVFVYTLKKARIRKLDIRNSAFAVLAGGFLGILSSFLGIGGGPINLMILSYFFSMDTKTAAFNSLLTIFFSQTLSFISTAITDIPEISWILLVLMMAFGVVGATIGRTLNKKMDNNAVDKLFMVLLVVIIAISCYNCIKYGLSAIWTVLMLLVIALCSFDYRRFSRNG